MPPLWCQDNDNGAYRATVTSAMTFCVRGWDDVPMRGPNVLPGWESRNGTAGCQKQARNDRWRRFATHLISQSVIGSSWTMCVRRHSENMTTRAKLLTTDEAAEILRLTESQVSRLAKSRVIPTVCLPPRNELRIPEAELYAWLESQKRPAITEDSDQ